MTGYWPTPKDKPAESPEDLCLELAGGKPQWRAHETQYPGLNPCIRPYMGEAPPGGRFDRIDLASDWMGGIEGHDDQFVYVCDDPIGALYEVFAAYLWDAEDRDEATDELLRADKFLEFSISQVHFAHTHLLVDLTDDGTYDALAAVPRNIATRTAYSSECHLRRHGPFR